ncbi:unnamed protein product [Schistosoma margrebowiei]|uniref:Uncharacterized protein n=1 Tax=Schistosoma margrebowiei TaxID=48269 RepID=A0A183LNB5_9TREM|nr:unnamed protein product [Schistosoma margrebowiei]
MLLYFDYEEKNAPHTQGVALMLSKVARNALVGGEFHRSRIIKASFKTKMEGITMNIIQYYAPTNDCKDDIKDQFYERLQSVIEKCPSKDLTIMMGDLNAKVGIDNSGYEDIMGRHGLGERNENGERFANLCAFNKLVIGGTISPHNRIHKATWISSDHTTENQIDHVCINKKFRRTMEDVRTRRGADIASDHHLVVANLKLNPKKNWTTGQTSIQRNTGQDQRKEEQEVQAQAEYTEANRRVKRSILADKKKYVEELATTAEKADSEGNMKQLHDTTKKLSGKYSKPERPVKDKEGKPITEIQQQRNRWVEYFEELLNRPTSMNPPDIKAAHTDLPIDVNPPTKEEIRMAVRQIKNGKAAGPDNIPAEALKPNCNTTDHRRTIS